ncbi:flap endonuclease 1-like isoform X2 [Hylaeus volcanicus]|uniref:flap endonuclease 1-like isoform X2 n=1 Tax=Hylaeus volcanicus TaxID=313075 RepID=UPI0023B87E3C|nr:flap endonuclease 1-like isoform X2 [Hylaeus volcanicus]
MGIQGLGRFLSEMAPECIRQQDVKSFLGQIIVIDASMSLYQFMIAIRDAEGFGSLTNELGEETSHISGFLSRCTRLLENGIKPVYVFDGKPTQLKLDELNRRQERRVKAEGDLEAARDTGDAQAIRKYAGRTVRITPQHNSDVKQLLELLGVPTVDAPTEAEAQCATIVAKGFAFATATEDADALTFGSSKVIRHLNFSEQYAKTKPILVFSLNILLEKLQLTMAEFVDFCILCGCDYCNRLKVILKELGKTSVEIENYPYKQAREFFVNPEVIDPELLPKFSWKNPQEDKLRDFLINRHNFNTKRVASYLQRLNDARGKFSQRRLDSFFSIAVKQPLVKKLPVKEESCTKKKRTAGTSFLKSIRKLKK